MPVSADKIDWDTVENIIKTPAWNNPLQKARPDVYLGTNERTLGGDRREYGYGKLRHGMGMALIMMIILKVLSEIIFLICYGKSCKF